MRAQILLRGLLKGYSLNNIEWLYRQFNNESNFGRSRLYLENKNPFGMSAVWTRPSTQINFTNLSDGNTNGIYKSVGQAVKDRFLWDKWHNISPNSQNYAKEVSKTYHPSPTYNQIISATNNKGFRTDLLLLLLPFPILTLIYIYA